MSHPAGEPEKARMRGMTPKQQRFVQEYIVDLNGTQAAIRAGYSPKAASVEGSRLLANAKVQAAVSAARAKLTEQTELTAERVVREFAAMALYDPADIASTPLTSPQDIATLPDHVRRAIIGWGWDRQGRFIVKLAPKLEALDRLARHLGLYAPDRQKVDMNVTNPYSHLSDKELDQLLAELTAKAGLKLVPIGS